MGIWRWLSNVRGLTMMIRMAEVSRREMLGGMAVFAESGIADGAEPAARCESW